MTSFGDGDKKAFYTGKPNVPGLGYAFLLRNYRSDLGKWQTADPLGYPDGLNNFAYVNNGVTSKIDWLGCKINFIGDNASYKSEVKEYLSKSKAGKALWEKLENDDSFNINVGEVDNEGIPNSYWAGDENGGKIGWDPNGAYEFEQNGEDKHISPALTLAHELAHALLAKNNKSSNREDEEKIVLKDYENEIAKELGEPVRTWEDYNNSDYSIDKEAFPTTPTTE
jgi:RHS repeat-associated protein